MKKSMTALAILALSAQFAGASEQPKDLVFADQKQALAQECGGYVPGLFGDASKNITKIMVLGTTENNALTYPLEEPVTACQFGKLAADLNKSLVGYGTDEDGNLTIHAHNPAP